MTILQSQQCFDFSATGFVMLQGLPYPGALIVIENIMFIFLMHGTLVFSITICAPEQENLCNFTNLVKQ